MLTQTNSRFDIILMKSRYTNFLAESIGGVSVKEMQRGSLLNSMVSIKYIAARFKTIRNT